MRNKDDNFGLIEILGAILRNKKFVIGYIILGIIVALTFTYTVTPQKSVKFTVKYGNTLLDDDILMNTAYISELLQRSKLHKDKLPYLYYERGQFYYADSRIDLQEIEKNVLTSVVEGMEDLSKIKLKDSGGSVRTADKLYLLQKSIDGNYIKFVERSLSINFSEVKNVYPRPLRHSAIGAILGFLFSLFHLGFIYIYNEAKKLD